MYQALDKPIVDRYEMQDLTDRVSTLVMAQITPGIDMSFLALGFTRSESLLLQFLESRLGNAVVKSALLQAITFYRGSDPEIKIVDVFICKIRKKLLSLGLPYEIETVWGQGYRLVKLEDKTPAAIAA
jgi:two-component system cell cycle response regulator CtrA